VNLTVDPSICNVADSPTDLNTFWKSYSPGNLGQTITDRGSGPNKPASPGDEAELDIQYLSSMGQGVDTTVWYTVNQNTPFLSLLLDLAKSKDVPNLFSCSYGSQEGAFSQAFLVSSLILFIGCNSACTVNCNVIPSNRFVNSIL
jgi:hypothetical protein